MSHGDYIPLSSNGRPPIFLPLRTRPRTIKYILLAVFTVFFLIVYFFWHYELHVEISAYPYSWIGSEITTEPGSLRSSCWRDYNHTRTHQVELQTGMNLRFGLDCYNFAGTISAPSHPSEKSYYHTYWRADLAAFGTRQEYMLKSFFATQHLPTSHLTLWSNGDLSSNPILQKYLSKFPESFSLRIVDTAALARGTPLEGSTYANGGLVDKKAWVDGDLLRLLLLWNFGGVWVDMDTLITRDMNPLTQDGQEWVTQWDCYDKPYSPLNGALMHFTQHSPYLCEAFDIMATSPSPRPGSTDWGSLLYLKLYRRLVKGGVQPFKILPWCFSDARSCRLDNRLPDPFVADDRNREGRWGIQGRGMEEGAELDKVLSNVFSVHLHNQWEKEFPKGGWVERLLLRRFERRLEQL